MDVLGQRLPPRGLAGRGLTELKRGLLSAGDALLASLRGISMPAWRRLALRRSSGGDAVPPLAAALAGRANPFARPGTHEGFLAAQALPTLPLIDAIGFGLLVRFIRHDHRSKLPAIADANIDD